MRQLERYRQFYRMFPITSAVRTQFSWTHYKPLLSIDNEDKREYYEFEASKNNWTARQLERQINSHLYERLLHSNDKESVLAIARGEKAPSNASEIIKDPMVLEFLVSQMPVAILLINIVPNSSIPAVISRIHRASGLVKWPSSLGK